MYFYRLADGRSAFNPGSFDDDGESVCSVGAASLSVWLVFSVFFLLSSLLMLMSNQSIVCCRDDWIVSTEGMCISHKTGTGNRHDISNAEHLQVAVAIIWSVNRSLWQWYRLYRQ